MANEKTGATGRSTMMNVHPFSRVAEGYAMPKELFCSMRDEPVRRKDWAVIGFADTNALMRAKDSGTS